MPHGQNSQKISQDSSAFKMKQHKSFKVEIHQLEAAKLDC